LQFGANPGSIVNQSIVGLAVQPGRTLGLVGGEVALEGGILFTSDGQIELGSVAGNSRVRLTPNITGYTLGYEGVENFQDIRLTQKALVLADANVGGGSIQVQGRNVTLTDGSAIATTTSGDGKGGNLIVNASDSVQVIGTSADGQSVSILGALAGSTATGEAGDVRITTPSLLVRDGAGIFTGTSGASKGGNVIVNASDSVQLIGTSAKSTSSLSSNTSGTGDAGQVRISTRQLLLKDGAFVSASTLGAGNGGSVIIDASDSVQLIGTSTDGQVISGLTAITSGTGNAGNVTITTPTLLVRDGASISTSSASEATGKGGNVTINASEGVQVIGTGTLAKGPVSSSLDAGTQGTGDGGELRINTRQLLLKDGASISANTLGAGKGGSLIINASDSMQLVGGDLSAITSGTGDGGEMRITTGQLLLKDGASISASTLGAGKGGSLIINASDSMQLVGGDLSAFTSGTGDGGEMRITTGQLLLKDGASILVNTLGAGKGGSLVVNASDWVQLVGGSLYAFTSGTGDGGEIRITTGQLLLKDGASILVNTFGAGKGGSVTIDASDWVQVIGRSTDDSSSSQLSAITSGTGDGGEIRITTGQLLVRDGAGIFAATTGAGNGGNLTVNASESVQVIGESADGRFNSKLTAQASPNSTGDAGNLTITTSELLIRDGAQVDASTFGAGKGGSLIVNASESVQVIGESADGKFGSALGAQAERNSSGAAGDLSITTAQLLISDGAQVSASTFGAGKGGNLTVNASESVQVIGTSADGQFPSRLSVRATAGSTAGNLTVETGQMSIRDGAEVTVSSPSGQAGNLTITADSLHLNQGKLTAVTGTSSAEGGANITLQGLDLLRMDNESLISASALENANGGNVTIDSTLIIATPPKGSEGSDIVANAVRGNGGSVRITTQGLFGIEFRENRTPQNDITVSSDFGLDGVFEQNTPGVDPSRGLGDLPTDVVDGTRLIDNRCTPAGATQRSSFVITGRGGLPPSPTDPLEGESVITNWVTLDSQEENTNTVPIANPTRTMPKQLVEAQSWVFDAKGQVILTAQSPTVTPYQSWQTVPSCHDLKPSSS
jgi:large exoprotein involved in heme utilization and adhesion